jgi:hypothetical protein
VRRGNGESGKKNRKGEGKRDKSKVTEKRRKKKIYAN